MLCRHYRLFSLKEESGSQRSWRAGFGTRYQRDKCAKTNGYGSGVGWCQPWLESLRRSHSKDRFMFVSDQYSKRHDRSECRRFRILAILEALYCIEHSTCRGQSLERKGFRVQFQYLQTRCVKEVVWAIQIGTTRLPMTRVMYNYYKLISTSLKNLYKDI